MTQDWRRRIVEGSTIFQVRRFEGPWGDVYPARFSIFVSSEDYSDIYASLRDCLQVCRDEPGLFINGGKLLVHPNCMPGMIAFQTRGETECQQRLSRF